MVPTLTRKRAGSPLDAGLGEVAPEGETCFGVWREGLRKAYVVNWADAPWKQKGLAIVFR